MIIKTKLFNKIHVFTKNAAHVIFRKQYVTCCIKRLKTSDLADCVQHFVSILLLFLYLFKSENFLRTDHAID